MAAPTTKVTLEQVLAAQKTLEEARTARHQADLVLGRAQRAIGKRQTELETAEQAFFALKESFKA